MGYNIAIDGPASAGKSTIAKLVAKKKGFIYVDTGAMYRAMSVFFMNKNVNADNVEEIESICKDADVKIVYENEAQQVLLNGENITMKLREESVGNMASKTATIPGVRAHLLDLQKNLAKDFDVVMDGRDIGTNILPNADLKIYLTASVDARANRRFKELSEKGMNCDLEAIASDIAERDYRDMNREIAPLKQATDAILVDSSNMTIEEVVETILGACN
ncbi:MAG: (d)CMP kinase [Eubacteriales bacterium]